MNGDILAVQDLQTHFPIRKGLKKMIVKAVDGVSFTIARGETFGLVGESGCGKSTVGRTLMRYYPPTGGKIVFDGNDITTANMKPYRMRMQMVFQDPYASLDPRMSVGDIVGEPLDIQNPDMPKAERNERVLRQVQALDLNAEHLTRFPHEFSGGQRQRISIARALVVQPELLICDEPVSALDVSIQAQIINMLMDLQRDTGVAYLFIAHDLSVVRHISQRVAVMYLGHIMEMSTSADLYQHPLHPYSKALLTAIPVPDPITSRARKRQVLQGDVPSPINPPAGCVFVQRCPCAGAICRETRPVIEQAADNHYVACHRYREYA